MRPQKEQALKFLKKYGMDAESVDMEKMLKHFLREMDNGLAGKGGSLAMIPTFLKTDNPIPYNEKVIVLDAGGTNLRCGTISFLPGGEMEIQDFSKHKMPGIKAEISADDFYNLIVDYLEPVITLADKIGFCFSYPVEISPDKDGKLLYWTKEVKIPEAVGQMVGSQLLKCLEKRGYPGKKIVLLNDTVATLLAGKALGEQRQCESYVGLILGTGTNTAYIEKNSLITKRDDLDTTQSQIINIESGNFNSAAAGEIDLQLDRKTGNPGKGSLEKMISGAYLGPLALEILKTAAEENLFSPEAIKELKTWESLSTIEMDDFLGNSHRTDLPFHNQAFTTDDLELFFYLFANIIAKAAKLTAVNIAGAVIKSGAGKNPLHPVCINIDGSTFYKTTNLPSMTETHLSEILKKEEIFYNCIEVENAPIIGAAIAGLTG